MQEVIRNYVEKFRPESYRFFTTYGISPEHLNSSSTKELPKEQIVNMKKVFGLITQQTKENGSMFYEKKMSESRDWMFFGYAQDEYSKMRGSELNCRIYLPIAEGAPHDYFMTECFKLLINSKIKFTGKVAKTFRNDSLMFEFAEREQAKKFVDLFMQRKDLKDMLGIHNPFLRDIQGLGFVDFENFNPQEDSYTSIVAHELEDYVFGLQRDVQGGKDNANIQGFKKFLEKEKANPNKNPVMLDQIIGEIEHCEILHMQQTQTANNNRDTNQSTTSKNQTDKFVQSAVKPMSANDSFDELKSIFEKYELIEATNGIGLKDRKTGVFVKNEERIEELVKKVVFAKKWIEAAGVGLSVSGSINEFGIDSRKYEYAFNDGARQTFESMFRCLAEMGQKNQTFDLRQLEQFVKNETGYKYSDSLMRGLLANPQGQEIYLPQNQGVPTKKPWEYSIIKKEIERMAIANKMAPVKTENDMTSNGDIKTNQPLAKENQPSIDDKTDIKAEVVTRPMPIVETAERERVYDGIVKK